MRLETDPKLDYCDVLLRPKRSRLHSRKEVELHRTFNFLYSSAEWSGIPIMASNMDGVGSFAMARALHKERLFTCVFKHATHESWRKEISSLESSCFAVTSGILESDIARLRSVMEMGIARFICLDVANGYSQRFGDTVARVREMYPSATLIAGNVATADMTQELILRGADIVKVGIGPGSVCTTRIQTGVGYPQLSATIECADAAHGLGGHIVADGGCACAGDIAKAFSAGADFVMLGGLLAGHDEGGGKIVEQHFLTNELTSLHADASKTFSEGKEDTIRTTESLSFRRKTEVRRFVEFYGMSSLQAMLRHAGGVASYRASEGRLVRIPYRGPIAHTLKEILGGLRSTCSYVGAEKLKDLGKCATFVCVGRQFNRVFAHGF